MTDRYLRIWISIIALALPACTERRQSIVGYWKSDPRQTQLGLSVDDLCFRTDGSYVAHSKTQAGTLASSGRYEVDGNTLRLIDSKGVEEDSIELHSDILITRQPGYKPLIIRYRRLRSTCD